ncbi:hypothetical protein AAG570_006424 [Ranatra chinensis]|uniref:Uncharacterized protein n=1 Tax=Ranatra chinensis TaxID=642074 RepID=A0ABD0YTY6_9HEMI
MAFKEDCPGWKNCVAPKVKSFVKGHPRGVIQRNEYCSYERLGTLDLAGCSRAVLSGDPLMALPSATRFQVRSPRRPFIYLLKNVPPEDASNMGSETPGPPLAKTQPAPEDSALRIDSGRGSLLLSLGGILGGAGNMGVRPAPPRAGQGAAARGPLSTRTSPVVCPITGGLTDRYCTRSHIHWPCRRCAYWRLPAALDPLPPPVTAPLPPPPHPPPPLC